MTDRFPAPWRIVEIPSGFAVEDATERQLGVFYGRADPKHGGPHRLSDDGRGEADCSRLLGPDGLSRFDELRRREAARTAVLYAFDLIEHDGEDLRNRPFLARKAELAQLLRGVAAGILLNEHVADDGPTVFEPAWRLGAEGIVSKRVDGTYRSGPYPVWIKVRNPASISAQRERSENWNR
jgi:bifunctional non-homologous end joining protein LigD